MSLVSPICHGLRGKCVGPYVFRKKKKNRGLGRERRQREREKTVSVCVWECVRFQTHATTQQPKRDESTLGVKL